MIYYFEVLFFIFSAPPKEHPPLASSGCQGERGNQQRPSNHQKLPSLCRQEQGYVSRIQEQAARQSLYSKPVFEMFQGKTQPSTLGSTGTATLSVVAEHKEQQVNQISGVFYFLPHLAPPTIPLSTLRETGQKMERGMDRWRGRL